jgi:hypothetical protein
MFLRIFFSMPDCVHKWVFVIGLLAVLVVFIAPSVDLPATALRAQQIAQCIMLGITLLQAAILFAVVLLSHRCDSLDTSTRPILRLHRCFALSCVRSHQRFTLQKLFTA